MTISSAHGRLLITCNDRPGIVAAVSSFLFHLGANILHSDQHTAESGRFFMRLEFSLIGLSEKILTLPREFQAEVGQTFGIQSRWSEASRGKRLGILVSREDHCLQELLWQQRSGDLGPAEIACVIGNHASLAAVAAAWNVPFHTVPVPKDGKDAAEARQRQILADENVDTVVLARYMQIVSPSFIAEYADRMINIHHSFLPAFAGARPYVQAHARGVKLIGATAHYVTEELDAGPIIEQDVHRVDHRHGSEDLRRLGRQVERTVLARAVAWHLEDRVLVDGNKTVVFS